MSLRRGHVRKISRADAMRAEIVLLAAGGPLPVALAALGVHTAAMLATIAAVLLIVYEWVGLAFLRSGWVNLDLIWIAALGTCGALLMLA